MVFLGVVAGIALAGWLFVDHSRRRKQRIEEQVLAMKRAAMEKMAVEKATAEQAAAEQAALALAATERLAAKRAVMEQAALEKTALEKGAVEQAIAEWAAAEQAEADRVHLRRTVEERRAAEEVDARMQAVEEAITEWLEAEREGRRLTAAVTPDPAARKNYTRVEAIHQQVRSVTEVVEKEAQELEFIKNRIQAGVDFLPIEVGLTIAQWKEGKLYRHRTFEDLKLKFRYQAYSIEDGYELLYRYHEWMAQHRQKLRVFIRLLGGDADKTESIQAAIERLERSERAKYLEMEVDVIFTLSDIRAILEKLIGMEAILKEFETVCRKRSEQVISPSWEARGSL
ncbi:MAG: hypothetical protein EA420_15315 [Candidatus Competibacteraceae bacterium]|nr:MAG: hypothetical protein EA420_15315 [Candidatus Competibacteraceae bacterium]